MASGQCTDFRPWPNSGLTVCRCLKKIQKCSIFERFFPRSFSFIHIFKIRKLKIYPKIDGNKRENI